MDSPIAKYTFTGDLSRRESVTSIGTLLFWAALAGALLAQIFGFMFFLRRQGYEIDPLSSFPISVRFVGTMVLAAVVVRCMTFRRFSSDSDPGLPRGRRDWTFAGVEVAAIIVVFSLTSYACAWPKLMIPVLNSRLWDEALIRFDTALCFGINPNEFLLTVFEGAPRFVSWILDHHYALFVSSQGLATAWFLTDPRPRRRVAFGACVTLLWLLGTLSYLILPALGPVYVFEGFLPRINAIFPLSAGAQMALLKNYENVQLMIAGETVKIVPYMGIAAMPSLHVAAHFFLFLWARFVNSPLRHLLLAMSTLTLIASVATGWHYLVDGLAGLVLAAVVFALAVVIYRTLTRATAISGGDNPAPQ